MLKTPNPTPPPPPPPPPPAGWIAGSVDLNRDPPPGEHPSASSKEQPNGHGAGRGILGPIPGTDPPPINTQGTIPDLSVHIANLVPGSHSHTCHAGSTPKMDFPKFDGVNPRLWCEQREVYFEIYGVSEAMKTRFATLNFIGSAALWLQTAQLRGRFQNWEAMHTAVCAHFDKDQYPLHMKQLENLRQTGSVADYQKSFDQLAHSILLYNPSYDDVFFVTRFLGGLKEEIRAPITLHWPPNLETAGTLALLQEAELEAARGKSQFKSDHWDSGRFLFKFSNSSDRSRQRKEEGKAVDNFVPNPTSDKLLALGAHRRANNLCFTCGEKWTGRNHKCPTQIPLHVIQELLEAVQVEPDEDYNSSEEDSEAQAGQVVMAVKPVASSIADLKKRNRTLRLRGHIGSQEILILVDSGSAATFISTQVASKLQHSLKDCETLNFVAADGSPMVSDSVVPKLHWHVQGHTFQYDTRVISLSCYC